MSRVPVNQGGLNVSATRIANVLGIQECEVRVVRIKWTVYIH